MFIAEYLYTVKMQLVAAGGSACMRYTLLGLPLSSTVWAWVRGGGLAGAGDVSPKVGGEAESPSNASSRNLQRQAVMP